ncbi:hydroxyethylthiazole kinase [Pantoea sp. A4]|uniref:hydroxyethylthiazole kinase n=1 Tax=Pantoea sp. A4 TaxID=1225184 RepID=UPI0004751BA8
MITVSHTFLSSAQLAQTLGLLRQQAPLVHCMTNDVVQTFTANVLLALGAAPAMVIDAEEAEQFSAVASALLINVGTLTVDRRDAMQRAIASADQAGTPWVLDPVAVGALSLRTAFCQQILAARPAAIRGNASEILALAQQQGGGRGVDSLHTSDLAIEAAQQLATRFNTIVAVTGEVDYITDGTRTLAVAGGDTILTRVVGTGCALSAVVAACCALPGDRLQHVASACAMVARAAEVAVSRSQGPGSFAVALLDGLWSLNVEEA